MILAALGIFIRPPSLLRKVAHEGRSYFAINPDFVRHFRPEATPVAPPTPWVAVDKPEGSRRVVLLGGAAAAGFPMTDYHLGRLVQARWRARFPGESVEVINLSMPGADARLLRRIAREAMALEPDMVVLYAGQNTGPAARDAVPGNADADIRAIIETARRHGAKVLVCLSASGGVSADPGALESKIAGDAGDGVAVLDAGRWLRDPGAAAPGDGGFFLDGELLTFDGRAAVSGLIVDAMAALWGIAPRDPGPEAAAAWWKDFPKAQGELRRDVMFTGYDEHDMWSLLGKQLRRRASVGAPGLEQRQSEVAARVRALQRSAALGWDTTDLVVAYDRAVLQNPVDPLVHFSAGRLLGARGEGVRAEEAFQRGFALQPDNAEARLNYAAMQLARGNTAEARTSLEALGKFDPRAPGLAKMGAAVTAREGDLPGAVAQLEKNLGRNPKDADSWLMLADLQMLLGNFDAAGESRRRAKACE